VPDLEDEEYHLNRQNHHERHGEQEEELLSRGEASARRRGGRGGLLLPLCVRVPVLLVPRLRPELGRQGIVTMYFMSAPSDW
jgi:hypothetical protein